MLSPARLYSDNDWWMEHCWNDTKRQKQCTKRKTCPSATLITADLHNFTSGIPCTKFLTKWNMISKWLITWYSYTVMRCQNKEQIMECEYYETITNLNNSSILPASKVQRVSSCSFLVQWWVIQCDFSRVMKTLCWHLSKSVDMSVTIPG